MICDKVAYDKPGDAAEHLASLSKRKKGKFSVYKCPLCGKYHKTTASKKSLKKYIVGVEPPKMPKEKRTAPSQKPVPLATEKLISKELAQHLKRLVEGSKYLKK